MSPSNFQREWSESPRLRLGVVVIVVLCWVYGLLAFDETITKRRDEIALLDQEVTLLAAQARSQEWMKVRDQAVRRLSEFRERVWREESEGHIQAAFQDWLHVLLEQQRLTANEMTVTLLTPLAGSEKTDPPTTLAGLPPEMRVARARVVMEFQPMAFAGVLAAIAANEHWVWVERLSIRNWGSPQVELELGALFAVGARDKS